MVCSQLVSQELLCRRHVSLDHKKKEKEERNRMIVARCYVLE
jgi:hypothetical protein